MQVFRKPWLRDLAKRRVRWRLSTGFGLQAGGGRPLDAFAGFLADLGVESIDGINRSVLERYLANLRADSIGAQRRGTHIGLLNLFFAAIRGNRLFRRRSILRRGLPERDERLPRALAEQVMAQLEDPDTSSDSSILPTG